MYDAFLKLVLPDGRQLRGESKDPLHAGWIDLESVSMAPPAAGTGTHGAARTAVRQTADMIKRMDIASAALIRACASGQEFRSAILEIVRGGADAQRLLCRFEDVRVESLQPAERRNDRVPREELQISYAKVGFSNGPAGIARMVGGGAAAAAAMLRAAMEL